MYQVIDRWCVGDEVKSPKSAIAVSKVLPVALYTVRLNLGTTGNPLRLIWISPVASRFQQTVTVDNGKQLCGIPGNCVFLGRSISRTNRFGSAVKTICGSSDEANLLTY